MSLLFHEAEIVGERYTGNFLGSLQGTTKWEGSGPHESLTRQYQYIGTGVIKNLLQDDKIWFAFETLQRELITNIPRTFEASLVDYGQDTIHYAGYPHLE